MFWLRNKKIKFSSKLLDNDGIPERMFQQSVFKFFSMQRVYETRSDLHFSEFHFLSLSWLNLIFDGTLNTHIYTH